MKKKVLSSALALMVVLETATTAFAAGDGTYNVTDYTAAEVETEMNDHNGVVSTEVKVQGGDNGESGFAVILPKTMDGTTVDKAINWKYNVTVSGDIAGDEYVSIVPEETFALKQSNKEDITASVDQPVTKFVDSAYNGTLEADTVKMNPVGGTDVSTTGNVTASGISAGTWKGSFWFNININQNEAEEIEYTPFTLTPDNYGMLGVSKEGDVVLPRTFEYDGVNYVFTTIGFETFCAYKDLTSVVIPDSVTSIESRDGFLEDANGNFYLGSPTFYNCTNLKSVTIPKSVTKIGENVFMGCTNLTTINYTGTEEEWNAIDTETDWNNYSSIVINYNYSE